MEYKQTNWSSISTTEATFKTYTDDESTLSVYIYEQFSPIECTSGHRDKCLKALEIVKKLNDGDKFKYYTKGDVQGWKEKYFYRLEPIDDSSDHAANKSPKDLFTVGTVIEHTNNGKGIIKEVIDRGITTQLKVLFYSSNEEMLVVLNTSTMSIVDSQDT
jgi:hypothetical protein